MLPDLLEDLTARQRRAKEFDAAAYLNAHAEIVANAEARQVADQTYAGIGPIAPEDIRPWDGRCDPPDFMVAARLDLEHPLYFADNKFIDCADCGCNLQVRPHAPAGIPVRCICCAARHVEQDIAKGEGDGR